MECLGLGICTKPEKRTQLHRLHREEMRKPLKTLEHLLQSCLASLASSDLLCHLERCSDEVSGFSPLPDALRWTFPTGPCFPDPRVAHQCELVMQQATGASSAAKMRRLGAAQRGERERGARSGAGAQVISDGLRWILWRYLSSRGNLEEKQQTHIHHPDTTHGTAIQYAYIDPPGTSPM